MEDVWWWWEQNRHLVHQNARLLQGQRLLAARCADASIAKAGVDGVDNGERWWRWWWRRRLRRR